MIATNPDQAQRLAQSDPAHLSWGELVPLIKETEERFREEQLEAFVEMEPDICGLEVLPFTPLMFVELDGCRNSLLTGGLEIPAGDIAAFLWRISPWFDRKNVKRRDQFFAHIGSIDPHQAASEITSYLARSYAPAPMAGKAASGSVAAWPSFLVHAFGQAYGWTDTKTLNSPFRILYQYLNRIIEAADPDFKQRCPAGMALRATWLEKQNAAKTPNA